MIMPYRLKDVKCSPALSGPLGTVARRYKSTERTRTATNVRHSDFRSTPEITEYGRADDRRPPTPRRRSGVHHRRTAQPFIQHTLALWAWNPHVVPVKALPNATRAA